MLKLRWRIVVPYLLVIAVSMGALFLALRQPDCLGSVVCVGRWVGITAVFLLISLATLTLYTVETFLNPVRQITTAIRRLTNGDMRVSLLLPGQDEVGDMARAFNVMATQINSRIEALAEERQQLDTVLTYMADGVLIVDAEGYVQLNNPAAFRMLHSRQTIIGRSLAEVVRHHQLIALWQRCQRTGREQVEAVEIGRDLFLQVVITPFPHREGYLMILQDLTQVHRLQTVRRDFVSNVSHELRTPLASLRAVVETLRDGAMANPVVADRFLERAEVEVETLTQMVEELLELSRIESGQVPLKLEKTAVSHLVLIPMDRVRSMAQKKGVELILDLPARLPPVLADPSRLQQVMTNLLHNAVKFTPGGGKVTVGAEPDLQQQQVIIFVQDTGHGIPDNDLHRIFERFYKSDRARTRGEGGTGLGLAIARHLVQAHKGQIWAKSREGKGSTFYFSLPIYPEK